MGRRRGGGALGLIGRLRRRRIILGRHGGGRRDCRCFGCGGARGRRLLGLGAIEADIDRDAAGLAERAHFRRTVEHEIDGHRLVVNIGVDRFQRRRQSRHHVGQIPFDRLVEIERELVVVAVGDDVGTIRELEYVADKGGLARHLDPDRRRLALLGGKALAMELALGLTRAVGKILDHLLRQAGRHARPWLGQQIDIEPLRRGDGMHLHLLDQRDADRGAVGIDARRADIAGGGLIETIDGDGDRFLERHHDDRKVEADRRSHRLVEAEHQARIAVIVEDLDLALDRIVGARRQAHREQRQRLQHDKGRRQPRAQHLQAEGRNRHEAVPAGKTAGRGSLRIGV